MVTASYGTATAKPLDDVLFTAQDENDGLGTEGEVKQPGKPTTSKLVSTHKPVVSYNLQTGWLLELQKVVQQYLVDIATWRAAVRTKSNAMCTAIDGAADVDALAALYEYNDAEPPVRPLGELPLGRLTWKWYHLTLFGMFS